MKLKRKPFRKKKKHVESKLQRACVKWYWKNYTKNDGILVASLNGVPLSARQKADLKKEGLYKGVLDLMLICNTIVFIEEKRPKTFKVSEKTGATIVKDSGGVLSPEQKDFMLCCEKFGWPCYVVDNLDAFKEIIKRYV